MTRNPGVPRNQPPFPDPIAAVFARAPTIKLRRRFRDRARDFLAALRDPEVAAIYARETPMRPISPLIATRRRTISKPFPWRTVLPWVTLIGHMLFFGAVWIAVGYMIARWWAS
jgi:hypothetical protein